MICCILEAGRGKKHTGPAEEEELHEAVPAKPYVRYGTYGHIVVGRCIGILGEN